MKKFFFGLLFLLSTANTQAQNVQIYLAGAAVGAAYSSLAAAIAAAASGDSLKMSAHTFYEHDVFVNKNLVIAGTYTGIDSTTIDAQSLGRVLRTKSRNITLRDLIITNGKVAGAGVGPSPANSGAGIMIDSTGVLILCGATIVRNNNANGYGGWICRPSDISYADSIVLKLKDKVQILNNIAGSKAGVAIQSSLRSRVYLSDNVLISDNKTTSLNSVVGGLYANTIIVDGEGMEGGIRIMNNKSTGNSGGLFTDTLYLNGTITVSNNTADSIGGGVTIILYIGGSGTLDVHDNTAKYGGGAGWTFYRGGVDATIKIHNNRAIFGGGLAYVDNGGTAVYRLNQGVNIYDNIADSLGGGVYCINRSPGIYNFGIYNANIHNNKAYKYNGFYAENRLNITMFNSRLFNPNASGKQNGEVGLNKNVFLESDSCWFGNSDTTGLIVKDASSAVSLTRWVVCDWVLNNGMPLASWAPGFPLAARFRLNTSSALPPNSFSMLQGRFSGTLGSFTPVLANMKSINEIESRFTVSGGGMATIMGIVDADTFQQSLTVTTNISEKGFEQVHIYPNPATEIIYIGGLSIGSKIEMYDMMGRLIFKIEEVKLNKSTIDLRALPSGNYLLKIINKNGEVGTTKLMKE